MSNQPSSWDERESMRILESVTLKTFVTENASFRIRGIISHEKSKIFWVRKTEISPPAAETLKLGTAQPKPGDRGEKQQIKENQEEGAWMAVRIIDTILGSCRSCHPSTDPAQNWPYAVNYILVIKGLVVNRYCLITIRTRQPLCSVSP